MSNVDLARDLYAAFGRGEIDKVLGAMDPGIEWREAEGNPYQMDGSPWHGVDAVVQNLFVRLGSDWTGFTVHPKEFHDAGDTVVVEVRYTAKHNETGKELDAQACHVWRMKDGKITSFQQFVDTAQLQSVSGVS